MTFTRVSVNQVESVQRSETIKVARGISLINIVGGSQWKTPIASCMEEYMTLNVCLKPDWVQDLLVRATHSYSTTQRLLCKLTFKELRLL